MSLVWLEFALCLAAIGVGGFRLSRYADAIATKSGLSRNWVGLVLMATVTSLPELVTGVSSVTLADAPDIAVGNVLGACVFNLFVLGAVDLGFRSGSVFHSPNRGHVLSAAFTIVMFALVGYNLLLGGRGMTMAIGHVGFYSVLIVALYVGAIRALYAFERSSPREAPGEDALPGLSLRQVALRYAGWAVLVLVAALALPFVAEGIAREMRWTETFVGTVLVAVVTTLPETVTTISALRLGAVDLAIGNLLGSSLFNVLILAIDDLLFLRGPLLSHVSPLHAFSTLSASAMSAVAIAGWVVRPPGRVLRLAGWVSMLMIALYLVNAMVLLSHGAGT